MPSGVIHNVAEDDETVLDDVRRYLSYFPPSAWSYPSSLPADEATQPRATPELLDIVSRDNRRVYDMRAVLDVVFDQPDWFEVQPRYGRAIICALAHLGGHPVAVVANQPQVLAGSIDADAADKAAHFIMVADSFHLPIVFLADNPGMLPGSRSERTGVLRAGARMFAAQTMATTIKLHLTLRKAYGFGSMVMSLLGFDQQSRTFAYPGATMGAMSAAALAARRTPARTCRPSCATPSCRRRSGRPNRWGSTSSSIHARPATRCWRPLQRGPVRPAGRGRTGDPHSDHALTFRARNRVMSPRFRHFGRKASWLQHRAD